MKFFYGLAGAILGGLFGAAIPLAIATMLDSNDSSEGLNLLFLTPLGFLIGGGFGIDVWLRSLQYLRQPIGGVLGWTSRKIWLVLFLYLGIPMVSFGIVDASNTYRLTPPSDALMIANFHHHKATFDTLVMMAQNDKELKGINNDATIPEGSDYASVKPERLEEYRRLFSVTGVTQEYWGFSDGSVNFMYWHTGSLLVSDASKSYQYLPKPPVELRSCLDGNILTGFSPDTSHFVFRHIEGNWYLEYDCEPD